MKYRTSKYLIILVLTTTLLIPCFAHSQVRQVPDSVVRNMQNEKDFLYANDSSYWQEEEYKPREPSAFEKFLLKVWQSSFLKVLLYIFITIIILFAVYHVVAINNFFSVSRKRRKKGVGAESDHDALEDNLEARLNETVQAKDYRAAVRYMYLLTLRMLNDNKVITLHAKSTNRDYVQQMYKHEAQAQFRHLTRIYEYVWYGEFVPTENQFQLISSHFKRFNPLS